MGVGKNPIQFLIDKAKQQDGHLIQLSTDKTRPDALKLYESLGFVRGHNGMKLHLRKELHMILISKSNYFILTGAMGAGKSIIINELRNLGILCIDEPARQVLAEQRAIEGGGVPESDPKLFTDLLLSRSIYQFKQMVNHQGPVIYDRGIPDNISYAKLFDLELKPSVNAAHHYQYNKQVFFLPAWEEIYENDDERKMTFKQAKLFGDDVRKIYEDLGYNIIEVPMLSPLERAEFIINTKSLGLKRSD